MDVSYRGSFVHKKFRTQVRRFCNHRFSHFVPKVWSFRTKGLVVSYPGLDVSSQASKVFLVLGVNIYSTALNAICTSSYL